MMDQFFANAVPPWFPPGTRPAGGPLFKLIKLAILGIINIQLS